jgi:hypothetical protein
MVTVPRIALSNTIEHYDPLETPDPRQWLALDEAERIDLVEDYHRDAGIHLPDHTLHATIHVIVESQIARGDELPAERTLRRLMAEGLDRHDALHAIGMELAAHMNDLLRKGEAGANPNQPYYDALEQLTAESWRRSADEVDEEATEAERILNDLTTSGPLLVEAIRAAGANRDAMVPLFVEAIDRCTGAENSPSIRNALFYMFHLLGEWREKSAYRSLARLLRQPADEVEGILGDAITETSHRVMAAVFDSDPQPLYEVILEPAADEFIRSRMCETLAMLALNGELPHEEATRFLRACYSDLKPRDECFVWQGWQSAIAMLGLVELKPLVEQAFQLGYISPSWLSFKHFEGDLQRAIEHPARLPWQPDAEFEPFGDTIEELSGWSGFEPDDDESVERDEAAWQPEPPNVPAVNPFKGIGRNDPCPCGSGKKFKKCCLNNTA